MKNKMTLTVFDISNHRNEILDSTESIEMSKAASKTMLAFQ